MSSRAAMNGVRSWPHVRNGMHSLVRATNQVSGRLSGRQRFLPSVLFLPPIVPLVSHATVEPFVSSALDALDRRARGRATSRELREEMQSVSTFHFSERDVRIRGDRRRAAVLSLICEQSRLRSNLLFRVNATFACLI